MKLHLVILQSVIATEKNLDTMVFMAKKREITVLTPTQIEEIATMLRTLSDRYTDIAARMKQDKIHEIHATTFKSFVLGIENIQSHLLALVNAAQQDHFHSPIFGLIRDFSSMETEKVLKSAEKQLRRQQTTKGKPSIKDQAENAGAEKIAGVTTGEIKAAKKNIP